MVRDAVCQCGSLIMRCTGEPAAVSLCHCLDCQRRTGSLFGVGAFFARDRVKMVQGSPAQFTRRGDSGFTVTSSFCSVCGSTVFWEAERLPSIIGVAIGAFADPDFPAPAQATWDVRQHRWLQLPAEIRSHAHSLSAVRRAAGDDHAGM